MEMGTRKLPVMQIFCTLIWVLGILVYMYVKIYQFINLILVHFTAWKLYLKKPVNSKGEKD